MFAVGLENRLRDLLSVGKEAIIVAILGITLPMLGGYAFGYFHDLSQIQSIFIIAVSRIASCQSHECCKLVRIFCRIQLKYF